MSVVRGIRMEKAVKKKPMEERVIRREDKGKVIGRCSICKHVIREKEKIVSCPFCDEQYHFEHLMEWVKIRGECPNCQKKLQLEEFIV